MKLQNLILITFLTIYSRPSFGIGFNTIGDFWDDTRDSLEEGLGNLGEEIKNGGDIIIEGTNHIIRLAFDSLQDLHSYIGKAKVEIPELDTKKLKIEDDINFMRISMPMISLSDVKLPKNALTINTPKLQLKISDTDLDNLKKASEYITTPLENLYNWVNDRLASPAMEKCTLKPSLSWLKYQERTKSQKGDFEECEYLKLKEQYDQDKERLDGLAVPMTGELQRKSKILNEALRNTEERANQ